MSDNYIENVYTGGSIPLNVSSQLFEGNDFSGVGRPSDQIIREHIMAATKKSTLPQKIYKEILRAMLAEFSDLGFLTEENKYTQVKCLHANPERAIAKMYQENSIILPLFSLAQSAVSEDKNRRRYKPMLIQEKYFNEKIQKAERIISFADVPVAIEYEINLWCKYMEDMDHLAEQVRLKFNPSMSLEVASSQTIKAFLANESNTSTMVTKDREDRIVRRTFKVTVDTYIPSPKFRKTVTGKIVRINVETSLFPGVK